MNGCLLLFSATIHLFIYFLLFLSIYVLIISGSREFFFLFGFHFCFFVIAPQYNDNNGNPYSDVFWLAALVQSVGELEFGQQV